MELHEGTARFQGLRRRLSVVVTAMLLVVATGLAPVYAEAAEVRVYAASSLTDALGEVARVYEQQSDNTIKFSFASSSVLARQISQGAPAAIYLSASVKWMDYVQERGEILPETRMAFVANQLALVAATNSEIGDVAIQPGFPLAELLGDSRLAMGNPAHVPAGIYAKQSLQALGVWASVKDKVARAANVRAALAYVAQGGLPLGIVYSTDAAVADAVKVVGIFPAETHDPIIYAAALTQDVGAQDQAARDFYAFLDSDTADRIMASYGFKVLD